MAAVRVILVVLAFVLVIYTAGMLVWEDFTYYDNSHFTNETLIGRNISLQVSPEEGRFWPLGHQEFNLLRHITKSNSAYHALRITELALVCVMLLVLEEDLSIPARSALVVLLLITPSMVVSFGGLIYPEANLVFWLLCLLLSIQRFESTKGRTWAASAVISSQFLLYYKETVFLLLLSFAAGRLVIRCRKEVGVGLEL